MPRQGIVLDESAPREARPSPSFFRPCWVDVDRDALRHNLSQIRARLSPHTALLAVVKANGYGHGMIDISRVALESGAAALGVSSLDEAVALRESGCAAAILILGSVFPFNHFPVLLDYRLTPTIASLEAGEALSELTSSRGQTIAVHLKIDSGFGRIGVTLPNAGEFVRDVARLPGLEIEGLYTHFASSDIDADYTHEQEQGFMAVVNQLASSGIKPRYIHMANSAAIARFPETHGTMVRPGLAIYGISPSSESDLDLRPALTWKSRVVFVKSVAAGTPVSYARTWTASRPSRIATLAIGYADGYPRLASNNMSVLIRGRRCPIVGRVTMDMTMADVTDLDECRVGDEVILIGRQEAESIDAHELAKAAQTNAYEILSRIGPRVTRHYHGR